MIFDKLLRFLEIGGEQPSTQDPAVLPRPSDVEQFIKDKQQCFLFNRWCNIDEMESEDDEKYVFTSANKQNSITYNRFQSKQILSRFGSKFDDERIENIIRLAWNFNKVVINKETGEFTPFFESQTGGLPPIPVSSLPPVRTILVD